MDDIRIGLIIIGVVILLSIYVWERRFRRKNTAEQSGHEADDNGEPDPPDVEEVRNYLVLYVNSPTGVFQGHDIRYALTTQGMVWNHDKSVFEYPDGNGTALFTVLNMVNPGLFPDEKLTEFETVGVAFLMMLPAPKDTVGAFEKMLQIANHTAAQLNGRLLDAEHGILTRQGINKMRDKIAAHYQSSLAEQPL